MQIEIMKPSMDKALPEIQWNHEELKKDLSASLKKYDGVELTEETVKEGKQEVANLRKLKTAIDDKRKSVKRYYLTPIDNFESKMKELTALIDEPIDAINTQVKAFESERIRLKLENVKAYAKEAAENNMLPFVTYDHLYQPKWENLGTTEKAIQDEVDERIKAIRKDYDTLRTTNLQYKFEVIEVFEKTLSLNEAFAEERRLTDQAERKRQLQEEQAKASLKEAPPEPMNDDFQAALPADEPLHTVRFAVTGTRDQLMALSNYLKNNQLSYEQIK